MFTINSYTESTFSALSFTGMLFAARKQYLLAAIAWSISCTARSNGILYAGFIIYDLVVRMDLNKPLFVSSIVRFIPRCLACHFHTSICLTWSLLHSYVTQSIIQHKIFALVKAGLLCLITWTGFVAVQFYGYSLYCTDTSNIDARPWCNANIPLIYTFVQDFYWYASSSCRIIALSSFIIPALLNFQFCFYVLQLSSCLVGMLGSSGTMRSSRSPTF